MHDQAMPPADPRAEFIAALREPGGYLTEHPSLPVPFATTSMSSPTGIGQRAAGGWISSPP